MALRQVDRKAIALTSDSTNVCMAAIIVIGFAEALAAPEVTWSLVNEGMTVVAFARKGSSHSLRHSRYVSLFEITPPERDFSKSLFDLKEKVLALKACSLQETVALMPLDDAAVRLCGDAKLDPKIPLVGPKGNATILALDKWQQIQHAQKAGFYVPPSRYIECRSDIFRKPVSFPLVMKPALASMMRRERLCQGRSWVCSEAGELDRAIAAWGGEYPVILQPFIPGNGEGIFGLATQEGVIGWSAHRRVRMMNPQGSGSSACASKELESGLKAAGEKFISESDWRGLFMIELLRDEAGRAWFMELNGRPWGSMALARRLGFEYPAWAARRVLTQNASVHPPTSYNGSLVCRHLGRELLYVLFSLRGPKSKALTRWPSPFKALCEILRFHRNDRWYNWRADDWKVFFSDLFSTLRNQFFKSQA